MKQFNKVPTTGRYGLGHALRNAVINHLLKIINALKDYPQFEQIPPNGLYGLGHALWFAGRDGYSDAIEALKSCPQFKEINFYLKPLTILSSLVLLGATAFGLLSIKASED